MPWLLSTLRMKIVSLFFCKDFLLKKTLNHKIEIYRIKKSYVIFCEQHKTFCMMLEMRVVNFWLNFLNTTTTRLTNFTHSTFCTMKELIGRWKWRELSIKIFHSFLSNNNEKKSHHSIYVCGLKMKGKHEKKKFFIIQQQENFEQSRKIEYD